MFVALLVEMGNPCMKISTDLQFIDTRAIIDAAVAATVGTINPLNAAPEYTRGQKMSPCRGPRVYSGAECVF